VILDYDGDVFTIVCGYEYNHMIEGLDKRWSKAKRHWRVYNATLNRSLLKTLFFIEKSVSAVKELETDTEKSIIDTLQIVYNTKPYGFQESAIRKMLDVRLCALFAPVGSGKTKISIDAVQSLYVAGKIDQILIIGLVSIRNNWINEIQKHWYGEIPWESIEIIGVESLSQGGKYAEIKKWISPNCCIVVDEGHKIKNINSKRTERAIKLGEGLKYKYIMTGTEVLNGESDLFAQFRFLDKNIIGIQTFIGFKNRYCVFGGFKGKKIIGYKRIQELIENLKKNSFTIDKKEAMPFLPEQTFVSRETLPTPAQKKLIKEIKQSILTDEEIMEGKVSMNMLTKMLRISQVAGGFDEEGEPVKGTNPKLNALKEIIEDSPDEQIVIFCRYVPEIKMILEAVPGSVGIFGEVSTKERHKLITEFQEGKHKYVVCQYQSGAIGLNMHSARLCVFFSFDFSLEMWLQAIGRIARMQQKRPMLYTSIIMRGSIDYTVHRALRHKENVADAVKTALLEE